MAKRKQSNDALSPEGHLRAYLIAKVDEMKVEDLEALAALLISRDLEAATKKDPSK